MGIVIVMPMTPDVASIDPFTKKTIYIARDTKRRALMQFFKPENWFTVGKALLEAGRSDLIGGGCDCLIPANPPKECWRSGGNKRTTPSKATTIARWPIPRSARRPVSEDCRMRDIGPGGSRNVDRTKDATQQLAL
jgi:hypothetical protein